MRIIDITQTLRAGMPVWPGDQPYEPGWSARTEDGSTVNVGAITLSLHTGTHADAPLHISAGAKSIDELPLDAYVGPAIVVEIAGTGPIPEEALRGVDLAATPRVLFKTGGETHTRWVDRFAHLSTDLARGLVTGRAFLVGLDTPSVDPSDSKVLEAHHILFGAGIAVLENLRLDHVAPGAYVLVAPPLKLEGMDASPVRALLVDSL